MLYNGLFIKPDWSKLVEVTPRIRAEICEDIEKMWADEEDAERR